MLLIVVLLTYFYSGWRLLLLFLCLALKLRLVLILLWLGLLRLRLRLILIFHMMPVGLGGGFRTGLGIGFAIESIHHGLNFLNPLLFVAFFQIFVECDGNFHYLLF